MSAVTWGVGGDKLATVFCIHCGAIFLEDIPAYEAAAKKAEIPTSHYCTPSKPWRPGAKEYEKEINF